MHLARLARFAVVPVVAILALASPACSSKDKDFNPAGAGSGPTVTQAPVPTVAQRTGNPFCDSFAAYNERFGQINPNVSQQDQLRTLFEDAIKAIRDAQAVAPDPIKADVATLSTAMQGLAGAFQQANWDPTRVNAAALGPLQAPEFAAASGRVNDYIKKNCV